MNFTEFKAQARNLFRLDLDSYKENQMRRRIDNFMQKYHAGGYAEFITTLKTQRPVYEAFLNHLTINVSEFFRDPKKFEMLEKVYIPELLAAKKNLKVWSAACSMGAEPYSIAIILSEKTPHEKHCILATDIDKSILTRATHGKFSANAVKNISPDRLARYFTMEGDNYIISSDIKKQVTFKHHDLLQDNYEVGFDLIICRNVTIYFTRDAQDRVNKKFSRSLYPGGILFIGGSEMIFDYRQLGLEKIDHGFYQRIIS